MRTRFVCTKLDVNETYVYEIKSTYKDARCAFSFVGPKSELMKLRRWASVSLSQLGILEK